MILTNEQKESSIDAYRAAMSGEPVQYWDGARWEEKNVNAGMNPDTLYRRKPKPALVPWDCKEDVPMNCWMRYRNPLDVEFVVTGVNAYGIYFGGNHWAWKEAFEKFEHSTDRKTWHPCTKLA